MSKPGKIGIGRVIDAFGYSMKGLAATWKFEAAFRQEVVLGFILIPVAFWLATTHVELILLIVEFFLFSAIIALSIAFSLNQGC